MPLGMRNGPGGKQELSFRRPFQDSKEIFQGLLEVPVGTGILTMPLYREMPKAEITCLDCSPEMLERAKSRGEGLVHVRLQQGDVGALPFENGSFDIVLSPNGFHAFFWTRRPPGGRFFAFCDLVGSSVAASMYGVKTAARTGLSTDCMCQRAILLRPLKRLKVCSGVWRKRSACRSPYRSEHCFLCL